MTFAIQQPTYSIVDYLAMLDRGEVTVNRDYQRSPRIWPTAARSFLVETVIRNFPIPKLSLHQKTDPLTLKAHKEVVDGQQRTFALQDYLNGKFRLSSRLDSTELHGKRFDDLPDEHKKQFLNYGLNFDLFIGADDIEVREVFRRMNTFTMPLNYEEQRHANFNGAFKWFIRDLTNDYAELFVASGVLKERGLLRMADAKLFAELCHAFLHGITTTSKQSLDRLYRERDRDFPEEAELGRRLREALDMVFSWEWLHGEPLSSRVYAFYSLVLATMHVLEPVEALSPQLEVDDARELDEEVAEANLLRLSAALAAKEEDEDETDEALAEFLDASSGRTNVVDQRITRTSWLYRALTEPLD
jgi:transcriptional regulator of met regulon